MARKRNNGQSNDQPERWPDDEGDELLSPRDTAEDTDQIENDNRGTGSDEHVKHGEQVEAEPDEIKAGALPSAIDLASCGFTPDEVQRLVVVSDRQAQSDESQLAEATLRRLRFTRWLIEHGMLDEWSA